MTTFKPGDADRHGKGTAWLARSRKCERPVHLPTGGAFEMALSLEFDPTVKKYVEQPVIDGEEGKRLRWPTRSVWFYVERTNGRRELHCTEDLLDSKEPGVREMAERLREGGVRLVVFEPKSLPENRLRNYVRLLGLIGESDGSVAVCAQQLRSKVKPGSSQTLKELVKLAETLGSLRHVAARAIARLVHEGALRFDLDGEVLEPETSMEWVEA